jgi:ankyrin repeat protein
MPEDDNGKLIEAIEANDEMLFFQLLARVKDINAPNANGIGPLMATVIHDRFAMFLTLLEQRPRPNVNEKDGEGKTALSHAIQLNRTVFVFVLGEKGAI